jgi:hypothetical protein
VNHRHLQPDEIDLLLDGGEGFGVAPLRAHLDECPSCMGKFRSMHRLMGALEALPHLVPAPRFAERVMSRVQVFEPWHVAARDRLKGLAPRSPAGRLAFAMGGGAVALAMTVVFVWVAARADAMIFLVTLVAQRAREAVAGAASSTLGALMGESMASTVQNGGPVALAGAALAAIAALGIVAFGMKRLATAGRKRRN